MISPAPSISGIDIAAVVAGSARLSRGQALTLFHQASLHDLGRWSTAVADRMVAVAYPATPRVRTYVIDRNINYTNVCSANCTFCAFKRDLGDKDAYTLSVKQLHDKIRELVAIGGTQTLLQGGMHPELPIEFYEEMLRGIRAEFPTVHVHGFSPPEFVEFAAVFDIEGFPKTASGHGHELPRGVWLAKLEAIMRRLMAAGLASIPGGGGEIFAEPVRRRIGLGKATAEQWLDVMAMGHRLGMFTSGTMMFGHIEGIADRIDHMARLRDAQDEAIKNNWPGRYVSFIAWPFQRENTPMGRLKEWNAETDGEFPGDVLAGETEERRAKSEERQDSGESAKDDRSTLLTPRSSPELAGKRLRMSGASDYLRTQAISRLFLDNIQSIGSSWVTMGPKIGQLGLFFGATDMGSVMMEENVVSAAGTTYCLNEAVLCRLIRDSGFMPAQRDNRYRILKLQDSPDSPDLRVKDWSTQRVVKLHRESHAEPEQKGVALTVKAEP